MLLKPLAGLSLLVNVSLAPDLGGLDTDMNMSLRAKQAVMQPLLQAATECVARNVAADSRYGKEDVTAIIVTAFSGCVEPVRALIDAHDRFYGEGTGQKFFMGPYLDALPRAVIRMVDGDR